jgi:hypothetical protein
LCRSERAEHENLCFGANLLGKVLQNPRLPHSRIATNLDVSATVEGGVNGGHTLVPCQHNVADPVIDIGKRIAGSLSESLACGCATPLTGKAKRLRPKVLDKPIARAVSTARRDLQRKLNQSRPKACSPGRVVCVQGVHGTFLGENLRGRALGGEVEDEDLKSAQQSPDRLVIVGRIGFVQVRFEGVYEGAHVIVG